MKRRGLKMALTIKKYSLQTNKPAIKFLDRCQYTASWLKSSSTKNLKKAKSFSEIPSPPAWPLVGHLPIMIRKETQDRIDKTFERLRIEFGDIFRLWVPGRGFIVVIFRPEDIEILYANDGKIPIIPGFHILEKMRKTSMNDRYASCGLINNTQDWCKVRQLVQQDMMRPKSALYYIADLEDIASELVEKISDIVEKDEMLNPAEVLHEYAAESVGCFFMGSRLGTLTGRGDGKRLIRNQEVGLSIYMKLLFFPHAVARFLPIYKNFVALQTDIFDICKRYLDTAIENLNPKSDSVIAKLVNKCGKDSPIPLTMGI
jgi:hypothetical protein